MSSSSRSSRSGSSRSPLSGPVPGQRAAAAAVPAAGPPNGASTAAIAQLRTRLQKIGSVERDTLQQWFDLLSSESNLLQTLLDEQLSSDKHVIKVRLVVARFTTRYPRWVLRCVHQVATPNMGMMHVALIVGRYAIDWNDSSVVIVRAVPGTFDTCTQLSHSFLRIMYQDKEQFREAFRELCRTIVRWNLTKTYDRRTANCQHFALEALQCFGIDPAAATLGSVGDYFRTLKGAGVADRDFTNPLDGTRYTFNSHTELDTYTRTMLCRFQATVQQTGKLTGDEDIRHVIQTFKAEFRSHWRLLKAYDRAFWLAFVALPPYPTAGDAEEASERAICQPGECPFQFGAATLVVLLDLDNIGKHAKDSVQDEIPPIAPAVAPPPPPTQAQPAAVAAVPPAAAAEGGCVLL